MRRLFGGLIQDIKLKAKWYVSDYKDGLHVQCIAAFFFMYFACLTPIVTFGGLLGAATDNYIVRVSASLLVSKAVTTNLFWVCYLPSLRPFLLRLEVLAGADHPRTPTGGGSRG